jgi:hypothetical protein
MTRGAERVREVRQSLEELGPLFVAFGRYLSARIDVLPLAFCEDLARLPDRAPCEPLEYVKQLFLRQLGAPPERVFQWFGAEPRESRLLWQSHDASLGGVDITVRILRPDIPEWIENADNLEVLREFIEPRGMNARCFRAAAADFIEELRRRQSFETELAAFTEPERGYQRDGVTSLKVYRHLSRAEILVHERLSSIEDPLLYQGAGQARSLCVAWLQRALQGAPYPVEPHSGNLGNTLEGSIVFMGGPSATLPERWRQDLRDYLIAAAAEDDSQALSHFENFASTTQNHGDRAELRRRFLQMVPFRDGFRREASGPDQLLLPPFAERVLIHWRLARRYGDPDASIDTFYRGLMHLIRTAALIAPGRDSLLDALCDLRVREVFEVATGAFRPPELAGLMEQYAAAMLAMPAKIDRLLVDATAPVLPSRQAADPRSGEGPSGRFSSAACLLLALLSAALLFERVAQSSQGPAFDQTLLLVLFLAFGLVLIGFRAR